MMILQKKRDFKSQERVPKHKLGYTIHTSYLEMYHRLKTVKLAGEKSTWLKFGNDFLDKMPKALSMIEKTSNWTSLKFKLLLC